MNPLGLVGEYRCYDFRDYWYYFHVHPDKSVSGKNSVGVQGWATMTEIIRVTVAAVTSRVDRVLRDEAGVSRKHARRIGTHGSLEINGQPAGIHNHVVQGDLVTVEMPETGRDEVEPEPMDLDILFEDGHLLAVNKPAGLITLTSFRTTSGTLANGVKAHWEKAGFHAPVRFVSRLDMGTSGVILIAKSSTAHRELDRQVIDKTYLALVSGLPEPGAGEIDAPIHRVPGEIARIVASEGQPSRTLYEVIGSGSINTGIYGLTESLGRTSVKPAIGGAGGALSFSLVRLSLLTGRTHQIRVHMAHIGHPLLGDGLYGESSINHGPSPLGSARPAHGTGAAGEALVLNRPALHAWRVAFTHPGNPGQRMELMAPLPVDMKTVMKLAGIEVPPAL